MAPTDSAKLEAIAAPLSAAGFAVFELDDDDGAPVLLVRRWGMCREMRSLDELARFAAWVAGNEVRS